jgi:alanine racemase
LEIQRSMSIETQRPTVAEIDLGALRSNFRALRGVAAHGELMVVVKADAYGHGAVPVARALIDEGCRHFGVATLDEARELREAGVRTRVYLQAGFFAEQTAEIVALDVTPFVFDVSMIGFLDRAAASAGRTDFPIHVKIDSGARRCGARRRCDWRVFAHCSPTPATRRVRSPTRNFGSLIMQSRP